MAVMLEVFRPVDGDCYERSYARGTPGSASKTLTPDGLAADVQDEAVVFRNVLSGTVARGWYVRAFGATYLVDGVVPRGAFGRTVDVNASLKDGKRLRVLTTLDDPSGEPLTGPDGDPLTYCEEA